MTWSVVNRRVGSTPWLNQESGCLKRPARMLPVKVAHLVFQDPVALGDFNPAFAPSRRALPAVFLSRLHHVHVSDL